MADGTTIGKAFIQIIPSAKGISGSIQDALDKEAKGAGTKAGKQLGTAIAPELKKTGKQAGKQIAATLPQEAKNAGTKAGKEVAKAIPKEAKAAGTKAGKEAGEELKKRVAQEAKKGGQEAGKGIERGLGSRRPFKNLIKGILPSARRAGDQAGQTMAQRINARLKSAGAGLKNVGAGLKNAAPQMMQTGAMATAASVPLIAGIKKSMDAYKVQSAAETKLIEIYKSRMGVSKKAAQSTMDLASKLQREGVIGDEVALSGAQQLATYAKMPGTVNTIMPAMENLLAQQKGVNATAEDATNIANLFGKAMMGQTGALKRVGISFDESQEKVLKYGTEEEKAAMLAQVVQQNVGSMNKEMLNTPEGKIQQLKNSLGDLVEGVGASLAPALAQAAGWLSENLVPKLEQLVGFMEGHPVIAKIVVGLTALLAVGGPLLIMIGGVISAVGTIAGAISGLAGIIGAIGGAIGSIVAVVGAPIIAIVAAVAALTAAFIYAYRHSEAFRNAVQKIAQIIKDAAIAAFEKLKTAAHNLANTLRLAWMVVGPKLTVAFQKLKEVMPTVIAVAKRMIVIGFTPLRVAIRLVIGMIRTAISIFRGLRTAFSVVGNAASALINRVKKIGSQVYGALARPFVNAKNTISAVVEKIRNFFPLRLGKILSFSLPKISIGSIIKKIGGKSASAPDFNVRFQNFARGAILDDPTIIGWRAGEAGREGIIPLEGRYMRPFAKTIAGEMPGGGNVQHNNFYITVDGSDSPEEFADRLVKRLQVQLRTA